MIDFIFSFLTYASFCSVYWKKIGALSLLGINRFFYSLFLSALPNPACACFLDITISIVEMYIIKIIFDNID